MVKLRGNPWAVLLVVSRAGDAVDHGHADRRRALAAVSCLAIRNGTGGPAGPAASADSGQMAGAISSPSSSGNSPGSSSGTTS
jgi:hypothetical protein